LVAAELAERLAVAREPASSAEELTVIAPSAQDARNDPGLTELVVSILTHPVGCPPAVAARWVGHPDVGVRRLVLAVPGLPATALEALSRDPEPDVANSATELQAGG
jgi:hypothetical protein